MADNLQSTQGHENEVVNVQGLKASFQKYKTDVTDGKVDKTTTVNGHALSGDVTVSKSDVGLGNVSNDAQVKRSEMGAANGVATLDSVGKVPSSQLPSYVDDVLEYDTQSAFPATGEGGKIYVDKSTNTSWRWSGSAYTQIKGDLALGETSSTAYAGDKGKALADKLATIAEGAEVNVQSDWNAESGDAFIKNKPTVVSTSANGLAPKVTDTSKFLKGDGTWATPTNTTYSNMTGATANAAGKAGLVPAPAKGKQTSFLRGDGTWVVPTNTTYSDFVKSGSTAAHGLVPKPSTTAGTTHYLREDGTWTVPPNTTYSSLAAASGGRDVSLCNTGEKYTWGSLRVPKLTIADYTTADANYTTFASVSSSSTSRYKDCTVLISGGGYYYSGGLTGTWLIEMRSTTAGVASMTVICLMPPVTSSTIKFGYYTDSNAEKTYFGIQSTSRRGEFNVTTLMNNSGLFTIAAGTSVTEAPTGWTEVNYTTAMTTAGGTFTGNVTATNFYTTSDRTKKENIEQYSEHISRFTLKETKKDAYGVIAQDVPEMFRIGEEGSYTVNYNSILSYYVGTLENKVQMLENKLNELENKVNNG